MELFTFSNTLEFNLFEIAIANNLTLCPLPAEKWCIEVGDSSDSEEYDEENLLWSYEIKDLGVYIGVQETTCPEGTNIYRCFSINKKDVSEFFIYPLGVGLVDEVDINNPSEIPNSISSIMMLWTLLNQAGLAVSCPDPSQLPQLQESHPHLNFDSFTKEKTVLPETQILPIVRIEHHELNGNIYCPYSGAALFVDGKCQESKHLKFRYLDIIRGFDYIDEEWARKLKLDPKDQIDIEDLHAAILDNKLASELTLIEFHTEREELLLGYSPIESAQPPHETPPE